MKSRTAFYFCNSRSADKNKSEFHRVTPLCETGPAWSCQVTLRKPIRNRNKSAMIKFETSFNNVPEQVSTFYMLNGAIMPAETCFAAPLHTSFS